MLYCRVLRDSVIIFFRGGLELEVWIDMPRPLAYWSTVGGAPLGFAKWGRA